LRSGRDFGRDEALSLGKAVAGLTAQSKVRRLGIYKSAAQEIKRARARKRGEELFAEIAGRQVPAVNTEEGVRAVVKDKPIAAQSVERYLESKFAESLGPVREAMREPAQAFRPEELAQNAFQLYEKFRPAIAEDVTGWGRRGNWIWSASGRWSGRSEGGRCMEGLRECVVHL
jgi:hypothetical protein